MIEPSKKPKLDQRKQYGEIKAQLSGLNKRISKADVKRWRTEWDTPHV